MDGSNENPSSARYLSYADGIATTWRDFLLLAARILAGLIYLQSGWSKLSDVSGFAAGMTRRGVPELLAYAAPYVEFLSGLSLVLGFATRYAALMLIAFTIAATWTSHIYWLYPEAQRGQQSTQFWKNVTMTGGLLALFVTAGGRFSLDHLLRRARN
jgi:putative oxidoreductase